MMLRFTGCWGKKDHDFKIKSSINKLEIYGMLMTDNCVRDVSDGKFTLCKYIFFHG